MVIKNKTKKKRSEAKIKRPSRQTETILAEVRFVRFVVDGFGSLTMGRGLFVHYIWATFWHIIAPGGCGAVRLVHMRSRVLIAWTRLPGCYFDTQLPTFVLCTVYFFLFLPFSFFFYHYCSRQFFGNILRYCKFIKLSVDVYNWPEVDLCTFSMRLRINQKYCFFCKSIKIATF